MRQAVFLDRDGVLTEPIWNATTGDYESPHVLADLRLCPNIAAPLLQLQAHGYELFIVSNQPSYAKGKASLEAIEAIARSVERQLQDAGIRLRNSYYCYHHPNGLVPELAKVCQCRKPEAHFLFLAAGEYAIDLSASWMIGDRDTDVFCGQRAGCRTILITHRHSRRHQGSSQPDYVALHLSDAAEVIFSQSRPDARSQATRSPHSTGPL